MNKQEQQHGMEMAQLTALSELVRIAIGEIAFAGTQEPFKPNLAAMERTAINALRSRRLSGEMGEEIETFVKSAANGYISPLVASINYPADPKLN